MENETNVNETQKAAQPPQPPAGQPPYGYGYYPYYQPPTPPKRSDKPRIAGGLLIVTGILGLVLGLMMIAGGTYMMSGGNFNVNGVGQVDISGVVLAADSTPIANATISVEGTHITVLTDASGHYQMLGVPVGYQQITLEKTGYNSIIRYVYIVPEGGDQTTWGNQMIITEGSELNYSMTVGTETFTYGDTGDVFAMDGMESLVMLFGVVFTICAVGAIVGGAYALKSEKYSIAIVGAVLGIFSVGFGIGSILAIIALLMLIISNNEFKSNRQG